MLMSWLGIFKLQLLIAEICLEFITSAIVSHSYDQISGIGNNMENIATEDYVDSQNAHTT